MTDYVFNIVATEVLGGGSGFIDYFEFRLPVSDPLFLSNAYFRTTLRDLTTSVVTGVSEGYIELKKAQPPQNFLPSVRDFSDPVLGLLQDESLLYGLIFPPSMDMPFSLFGRPYFEPGALYNMQYQISFPPIGGGGAELVSQLIMGFNKYE